jgi:prolyl oligopeptidase
MFLESSMHRSLRPLVAIAFASLLGAMNAFAQPATAADPYLWLEDVNGERALQWVRERNAVSGKSLESLTGFDDSRQRIQEILNNKDQIPTIGRRGGFVYNFWRDAQNPRGLWRRTTLAEYRKSNPVWDTLIDLDSLGKQENTNWVWGGSNCLPPRFERCLLTLSKGGADAKVVREFDLATRQFVKGGFELPEAKSQVQWRDANTLLVASNFGPDSITLSGYPRLVKQWKRGTPLASATTVFEGQESDVSVAVTVDLAPGFERTVFTRAIDFFNTEQFLLLPSGEKAHIDVPRNATLTWNGPWAFLQLKSDYAVSGVTHVQGSLLALPFDQLTGRKARAFDVLFVPTATRSLVLEGPSFTQGAVLLNVLDNVAGRLLELRHAQGRWVSRDVATPFPGKLGVVSLHDPWVKGDPLADQYLLTYADFLTPASLLLGRAGSDQTEVLKRNPAFFDAGGMHVEQHFAKSTDGTAVPYFVVFPKGEKASGSQPTLLYGYGGFQVSMNPWYSGVFGSTWLERGGIFVLANIRGGGEFGPVWHQAAMKQNKQKSYDDFVAVAQDLIGRGITKAQHLGIMGGSNGGLLVGAVMLQRPDLFGAVVCSVPLLDMQRYHKLLAGNSWMAEYGDPDKPEEWAFIRRYSPYQNVKAGVKYPKVLFTTSTRDDRVHPGHARKMAARMLEQGHDVLYYENIEGGHGGAADNAQRARLNALELSFLWDRLKE